MADCSVEKHWLQRGMEVEEQMEVNMVAIGVLEVGLADFAEMAEVSEASLAVEER